MFPFHCFPVFCSKWEINETNGNMGTELVSIIKDVDTTFFPQKFNGTKYSRMDQVNFVEDSL